MTKNTQIANTQTLKKIVKEAVHKAVKAALDEHCAESSSDESSSSDDESSEDSDNSDNSDSD